MFYCGVTERWARLNGTMPGAARMERLYTWQVWGARQPHLCAPLCPGTHAPRWRHALKRTARRYGVSNDDLCRLPGRVNAAVLTCMSIIAVCTEYVPAWQHELLIRCQQAVLPRSADSNESRELLTLVQKSIIRVLAPRKTMYAEPSV